MRAFMIAAALAVRSSSTNHRPGVKQLAQTLPGASYSAAALTLSFCVALAVLAMVFVMIFWDGGTLEQETTSFVTHYTAARPAAEGVRSSHERL
jgi:hypothetical protein